MLDMFDQMDLEFGGISDEPPLDILEDFDEDISDEQAQEMYKMLQEGHVFEEGELPPQHEEL